MSSLPVRPGQAADLRRTPGTPRTRSRHDVPLSHSAWRWGPYLALTLAGAAALAAPSSVQLVLWLPLLGGLVIVGMPHGAIDHLVPGRLLGRALTRRALIRFLAGYVLLAAAGVALWLATPQSRWLRCWRSPRCTGARARSGSSSTAWIARARAMPSAMSRSSRPAGCCPCSDRSSPTQPRSDAPCTARSNRLEPVD